MILNRRIWYIAIVNAMLFALLELGIGGALKQFFKIFFQTFGLFFCLFYLFSFLPTKFKNILETCFVLIYAFIGIVEIFLLINFSS